MTNEEPLIGEVSLDGKNLGDVKAKRVSLKRGNANNINAGAVELIMAAANEVRGEQVVLRQAAAQSLSGTDVVLRQGAVVQLEAESVQTTQSALALTRTEKLKATTSSLGGVWASEATLDQSLASLLVAPRAVPRIDQSAVGGMLTGKAEVHNGVIGFLIAAQVEGDYQVAFGTRAALAFGAAFGLVMALVLRLTRRDQRESS
jgi:hypothetical protein